MNTSHNEPVPRTSSHMLLPQVHLLHCLLTGGLITHACSAQSQVLITCHNFMTCAPYQPLSRWCDGQGKLHTCRRREIYTQLLRENLKEGVYLENLTVDWFHLAQDIEKW